jgi:signal transduction histidine kinase
VSRTLPDMLERSARVAAPAALALFTLIGVVLSDQPLPLATGAGVVAAALGLVVAAVSPEGWPLVCLLAVVAVPMAVICSADPANLGWFGLCVLAGWAAFAAPPAQASALAGLLAVVFAVEWTVVSNEPGWGAWIAGTAFTTVACQLSRRQRQLVFALREAQAGLAERARAEERNRIAREMHDVIGHALTVSVLHVSSARLALDDDPEEARTSLAEAERLAQQSLAEVRAAVGLMRGDGPAEHAPMPGTDDLEELVASFRRAGTPVSCDLVGDLSRLTATAGLVVYRLVQESLTNVARHAPGVATAVRVEVDGAGTRVTVDSAGAPGRAVSGTGLLGMRERVEAVGGRFTAGPWRAGWRVEAVLPS